MDYDINQIITILVDFKSSLVDKKIELRRAGKQAEAEALNIEMTKLDEKIDDLSSYAYMSWANQAEQLDCELVQLNQNIQDTIEEINANIETVENIAKILGYIDQIAILAASAMP